MKDSARVGVTILLRITTDGHKASRGLSATAELLIYTIYCVFVAYYTRE